jgi:dipeptidyl aminopeptidase/acylaminoacyl peptidase
MAVMRFQRLAFSLVALSLCLIASGTLVAQAGRPPIIDRELFFGNPEISGAMLSPDGRYVAFLKPYKDTRNIWVKRTEEPFDNARLVTADTKRPIPAFFWSRDSKYILFVQDQGGDENYNVFAVDPASTAPAGAEVPPARNLTDAKGARALIYSLPKTDADVIFVGLNDRDAAWHDLYRVRISTGERTLVRRNADKIAGWHFDLQGRLRLAQRVADNGDTEILSVTDAGFTKVYGCTVFETCGPTRFHSDGMRTYMVTNVGNVDLIRLVLFNPETKKEDPVESDPLNRVDFGAAIFSEKTDELLATTYEDERTRHYFRDKSFEADFKWLQSKLPGKDIERAGATADERLWMVVASGDAEPGERHLFDRDKKTLVRQYRVHEKLQREHLAPMQAIRYKSSDGLEIPAFLTLPKGLPPTNLPLVLLPHGGPWGRDSWGYDSLAQFLANRGYAVLQPNFRGSTGYGKKFLDAGNNQWGEKMQDDLTWGAKHLVAEGTVDPKQIGIMGGSYGGYATLAGVAFTPDLYAAAVSIVGPSNLLTLLESIPPYWEAFRKLFHARMGDPTTAQGKAQLERQSPLNSAAKIRTPLLVAQGANDPRVKKAESDQIVIALRDRGFPVEYLVAPDEGHGFARPVNNMAMFAAAEKFLAQYLKGRFQEGMPADVSARLKEITVDPKTVVLTRKVDPSAIGVPKPATDLRPGTWSYQAKIELGGQSIALTSTTAIAEEGGSWVATETVKTPSGDMNDKAVIEKGSLVVKKRSITQGPMTVELAFDGGKATGTIAMGGAPKAIAVDTGGALFADGAGASAAIGALPLADGYTTAFRNFDVQKQKPTLKQLKVAATEQVTVPAGTFKAFKVEVSSAEGEPGGATLWIDTDTRRLVKIEATLPQMGGAKLISELTK